MSLVNQVETPHVGIPNSMCQGVSPFYSSATNLQYVNPTLPMDGRIPMLLLAIRSVTLNHHMLQLMLVIFYHRMQL